MEEAKRTNYVTYLVWQWMMTNVNIRKAALVVKSERLNIPLINDPSSEFSNDNGDDEEEDLEEGINNFNNKIYILVYLCYLFINNI